MMMESAKSALSWKIGRPVEIFPSRTVDERGRARFSPPPPFDPRLTPLLSKKKSLGSDLGNAKTGRARM